MTAKEVDDYLAKQDAPARETLQVVRERILAIVPDAEECISYGMPGFKIQVGKKSKAFAGLAAFKNHLGYFPHSGQTVARLGDKLGDYTTVLSGVHFERGEPLPVEVVRMLIEARLQEIEEEK
jgi:uncharacterized protein YdhG (YjbR/CyaY superfamily)